LSYRIDSHRSCTTSAFWTRYSISPQSPQIICAFTQTAERGLPYTLNGQHESQGFGIHMNLTNHEVSTWLSWRRTKVYKQQNTSPIHGSVCKWAANQDSL